MLVLLGALSMAIGIALSSRSTASGSGSCALGANCSGGCWSPGHGDPYYGAEPYCIIDEDSPPCYVCIYNDPSPGYFACSENPDRSESYCSWCRIGSYPSNFPECPSP